MTSPDQNRFPSISGVPTNTAAIHLELHKGMQVGGFRLDERLGRGGMGEVWKAWSEVEDRHIVLKVLPPELKHVPEELDRVRHSFQQIHALQHEHICPVYQFGDDPAAGPFLVLKFVDGITLSAYRRRFVEQHCSFALSEVARVLAPVARALDYAHAKRVIHRDIKPDNIMLQSDGTDVQVVDFGLATEIRTTMTRVSKVQMDTSGTYPYMAPEQWRGQLQDARTDQYALAVVAYELLAGHLPFEAADDFILRQCVLNEPIEQIKDQPVSVNQALVKGLAKERGDRFLSCVEFVDCLTNGASTGDVSSLGPPVATDPTAIEARSTPPRDIREFLNDVGPQAPNEQASPSSSSPRTSHVVAATLDELPPAISSNTPPATALAARSSTTKPPSIISRILGAGSGAVAGMFGPALLIAIVCVVTGIKDDTINQVLERVIPFTVILGAIIGFCTGYHSEDSGRSK